MEKRERGSLCNLKSKECARVTLLFVHEEFERVKVCVRDRESERADDFVLASKFFVLFFGF